ncbi:MAG: LCP family protein [Anaerovoracaceae bacterium]|jgi:LCP family protein required for cell wall assembly
MRSKKYFNEKDGLTYSQEVIRKYEDPAYAAEADRYEREQRRHGGRHEDPNGRKRRRKKKGGAGRVIRRVLLVILILLILMIAYIFKITSNLDKVDTSNADFAISTEASVDLLKYRNIAILGSDARKGESYDGSRTDAIIIFSINRVTDKVRLISIMRDSYLKIADGNGNLMLDKITHAHHYGGGVDTCASLNRSLDLNIKEYVIFNWKAVADAVDTLGGITINVRKNEIHDLNQYGKETAENVGGTYHRITHSGEQTLDGTQAATYCRIRKTSGGDTGRARRYKTVLNATLKKAATSPWKLGALSEKVMPEIRTNMSQYQLMTLIFRAPGYDIEKNISWPKSYYGGIVHSLWYAVPTTLNSNVRWLHRKAFDDETYTPSQTVRSINDEIIQDTGLQ